MPELPEVEIIVNDLAEKIVGKTIKEAQIFDNKVANVKTSMLRKSLVGEKIIGAGRRAKIIIIKLKDNYLVIHLKMTGQLVFVSGDKIIAGGHTIENVGKKLPNKYTRVVVEFNDKSKLYFNDQRRFGWVKIFAADELKKILSNLGYEPLKKDFNFLNLKKVLKRKRKSSIKQALMDQKIIAGIGNIYADESLFEAGINPLKKAGGLNDFEIKKLLNAIKAKLKLSIKYRGTTFNNYIDTAGSRGNFSKFLKVYGREGKKCKNCDSTIKKTKLGGRGTHYCPRCQK